MPAESPLPSPFYYSPEELAELLTKRGVSEHEDARIRCINTSIIRRLAQRLGLPYYTCATTLYMYHRFVARYSISKSQQEEVILACTSLAMKAEETVKRLRDVYIMLHSIIHDSQLDPDIKLMNDVRDHIMNYERMILEDMQFELCIRHVHHFVLAFNDKLGGSIETARRGWKIAGDSYRSTVCIQFPPHIIALAALFLADKTHGIDPSPLLFDNEWVSKAFGRVNEVQAAIMIIIDSFMYLNLGQKDIELYTKISFEVQEDIRGKIRQVESYLHSSGHVDHKRSNVSSHNPNRGFVKRQRNDSRNYTNWRGGNGNYNGSYNRHQHGGDGENSNTRQGRWNNDTKSGPHQPPVLHSDLSHGDGGGLGASAGNDSISHTHLHNSTSSQFSANDMKQNMHDDGFNRHSSKQHPQQHYSNNNPTQKFTSHQQGPHNQNRRKNWSRY
ncbi:hypothetical protein BASA81_009554 [Batrachochytrium salamandrivorans]|nr:hypothetical protein BASA81_009554 [Batrachochytrium salamandrivorans]